MRQRARAAAVMQGGGRQRQLHCVRLVRMLWTPRCFPSLASASLHQLLVRSPG